MIIYALITIAIFGMWYYARYEGNFLPSPKKTFNPMMIVAIVILAVSYTHLDVYKRQVNTLPDDALSATFFASLHISHNAVLHLY